MVVVVGERVAKHDALRDEPRELRDELLAHVAVDEQALAGGAALARAEEAGGDGRLGGEIEVGVVEDDHRAVAAELEHRGLAGGGLGDAAPGLGRADEADAVRARVARDLVADGRAGAGDEVEDAGRQVGLGHALGQRDPGDGGRGRRRPDDGVAGGERGRDQLGRHRVRPVPGRDHADHAARPAQQEDALVAGDRVGHASLQPLSVLGGVAPVRDQLLDLVARLGDRLALVERQRVREALAAPLDLLGDAVQRGGPLECAQRAPSHRRPGSPRRSPAARRRGRPRGSPRSPRRSPATQP